MNSKIRGNNEKFVFTDWGQLIKVVNINSPWIKIDVRFNKTEEGLEDGVTITVLNIQESRNYIIYRIDVNRGDRKYYSLSEDEAVRMLNQIGFNIEYSNSIKINERVYLLLTAFKELGGVTVQRFINNPSIDIYDKNNKFLYRLINEDPVDNFNYYDWTSLKVKSPYSIDNLIKIYEDSL